MHILITVCARGGSKGIPGKNIKPANGIPLITYTIRHAKEFARRHAADIALSTEDPTIRAIAARDGLTTEYIRPPELANDVVPKVPVIDHLLRAEERRRGKRYDSILDLYVNAPLRTQEDLEGAFRMLEKASPEALDVFSVSLPKHSPYSDVVERKPDGFYDILRPGTFYPSRQACPEVFELNGSFTFYRRAFFDTGHQNQVTPRSLAYLIPHVCFEIDEPIDFVFLEFLLTEKKLDFPFS